MALCKSLKLSVDLEINAVSCPGVWLPNKGDILVRIWLLDSTARTVSVFPVFPLVYNERFYFEKIFDCQRLPELHKLLSSETVRAELQQLRSGRVTPLANFECSLLTLLFPDVDDNRPGLRCTEEVALCMQPLFHFPGTLSPKIQLSTKTIIEETLSRRSRKFVMHKTISSQGGDRVERSLKNIHQLARQAHSRREPSPSEDPERARWCLRHRPPFAWRHVDPDIFKAPCSSAHHHPSRSVGSSSGSEVSEPECRCRAADSSRSDRRARRSPHRSWQEEEERSAHGSPERGERISEEHSICYERCAPGCAVCSLYRTYFGSSYPAHLHAEGSSWQRHLSQRAPQACGGACQCQTNTGREIG